jgi:hypothetical protein
MELSSDLATTSLKLLEKLFTEEIMKVQNFALLGLILKKMM